MRPRIFRAFGLLIIFGACYLAGATVAEMRKPNIKEPVMSTEIFSESQDWGLGFSEPGQPPTGMATVEELKKYDAHFKGYDREKTVSDL